MKETFGFYRGPRILFGAGVFGELGNLAASLGGRVLVVTGERSLKDSGYLDRMFGMFKERGIDFFHVSVSGEPTPDFVDYAAGGFALSDIEVVVGAGGGSAIDAGKAVSAMLPLQSPGQEQVEKYLEGVGGEEHPGCKVPYVAVPTTAGTGSEATKNAVLSRTGREGFKKSLRHDNLVPDLALVDPELQLSCPADVSSACGMDAFTQLLESLVSRRASPLTDALAYSGLRRVAESLVSVCSTGAGDLSARGDMAYASLLSGVTLANAGLGTVHGLAASVGGLVDIPHGVVCGTLVGKVTEVTIRKLESGEGEQAALDRYAAAGTLVAGADPGAPGGSRRALVETIAEWTERLGIPRLGRFGFDERDAVAVARKAGNKNNPVELTPSELEEILLSRT